MNTKHLLFAYSLPVTSLAFSTQFGKQSGEASFTPVAALNIGNGASYTPMSMCNMHCCC
ncbi:hypothetical protein [Mucilaginibacter xinganensis]|uniref:Uncharacterized protein n=1 Tax=Mucilaginibacter xinganensis TaxID=1234841 RepID=A0A223NVM4_9SPHI|nr:hypothetical protein [Mucilaginibacter xinganensis]ASU33939.1 hypothetical protein MuYL_2047 [Mucilaginibacter xinganensis]